MKVSVIVTTYKDLQSLKLVLEALFLQDYLNFEVIVAEDDDDTGTVDFLKNYKAFNIKHVSQPNTGRKKTRIQNKAIKISTGDYLIFLDGDVLPYKKFISSQLEIAKKGQVLAGRRVNLNEKISKQIKDGELKAETVEKYYFLYAMQLMLDKEVRFEQGIYINPKSFIYKYFLAKRKRNSSILGCNWSCFKDDFIAINGFDEGYVNSSIGEDTDLDWRFEMAGYKIISSKNIANVLHLYHEKSDSLGGEHGKDQLNQRKSKRLYISEEGLSKHNE